MSHEESEVTFDKAWRAVKLENETPKAEIWYQGLWIGCKGWLKWSGKVSRTVQIDSLDEIRVDLCHVTCESKVTFDKAWRALKLENETPEAEIWYQVLQLGDYYSLKSSGMALRLGSGRLIWL